MKISEQKLRKLIRQVILEEAIPKASLSTTQSLLISAAVVLSALGLSHLINDVGPENPNLIRVAKEKIASQSGDTKGKIARMMVPDHIHAITKSSPAEGLKSNNDASMMGSQATEQIILNQHYKRKGSRV